MNGTEAQTDWEHVNWRQAQTLVRRLRQRIFRASQRGDLRLRSLTPKAVTPQLREPPRQRASRHPREQGQENGWRG